MAAERTSMVYHYLESGEHLVFCAPWFRREGLCLFLYNDKELAVAAASEKSRLFGYDIDLGDTDDIVGFLRRMADFGFAGAVLNDLVPVIFCREADGTPAFLRSLQTSEGGFSHFEKLLDDGSWDVSAAVEGISPLHDQQRFDRLIAGLIGEIPFRGHSDAWSPMTWSDVASDRLPVIDAAEGAPEARADALRGRRYLPVFSRFEYLEQFITEQEIDPATVQRRDVDDLPGLARLADEQEALVLLNPGQHRADTAAIGWREGGVALTSFSGRWFSSDGKRFRREPALGSERVEKTEEPLTLADELAQRQTAAEAEVEPEAEKIPVEAPPVLDISLEVVELAIPGDQVESTTVTHALSWLCASFNDRETLCWAAGRFHFRFPDLPEGQDPYEQPGIRQWIGALDRLLPVMPYFLADGEGGQADVARALMVGESTGEGDEAALPSPTQAEYVEDRALMIQAMGEKYGVDVRQACEALARTFSHPLPEHFFIDSGEPAESE